MSAYDEFVHEFFDSLYGVGAVRASDERTKRAELYRKRLVVGCALVCGKRGEILFPALRL